MKALTVFFYFTFISGFKEGYATKNFESSTIKLNSKNFKYTVKRETRNADLGEATFSENFSIPTSTLPAQFNISKISLLNKHVQPYQNDTISIEELCEKNDNFHCKDDVLFSTQPMTFNETEKYCDDVYHLDPKTFIENLNESFEKAGITQQPYFLRLGFNLYYKNGTFYNQRFFKAPSRLVPVKDLKSINNTNMLELIKSTQTCFDVVRNIMAIEDFKVLPCNEKVRFICKPKKFINKETFNYNQKPTNSLTKAEKKVENDEILKNINIKLSIKDKDIVKCKYISHMKDYQVENKLKFVLKSVSFFESKNFCESINYDFENIKNMEIINQNHHCLQKISQSFQKRTLLTASKELFRFKNFIFAFNILEKKFDKTTKGIFLPTKSYFVCSNVTQHSKKNKNNLKITNKSKESVTLNFINTFYNSSTIKSEQITNNPQTAKSETHDKSVNTANYTIIYISVAACIVVTLAIIITVFVCKKQRISTKPSQKYEEINKIIMPTCGNSISDLLESSNTIINNEPVYYSINKAPESFYVDMSLNKSKSEQRNSEVSHRSNATANMENNFVDDNSGLENVKISDDLHFNENTIAKSDLKMKEENFEEKTKPSKFR